VKVKGWGGGILPLEKRDYSQSLFSLYIYIFFLSLSAQIRYCDDGQWVGATWRWAWACGNVIKKVIYCTTVWCVAVAQNGNA
jgi:hypothetical protein